ncbi:MAG: Asp23/Gls24 family envelope stress response protein [Chloroflexi bacterium]|nr:Asp23/Gls24 family envelope stress response protein [Chloroflexota bacterium]
MGQEASYDSKIVIAPEVLITIAKLATLGVPGVAHMAPVPGGIDRYFKRGAADGVRIQVFNHDLAADLHIVITGDANARAVSEKVQSEVARAMSEMVGMTARTVNVHIENVEFAE